MEAVPGDKAGFPQLPSKGTPQSANRGLGPWFPGRWTPVPPQNSLSLPAVGEVSPTVRVADSQQTTGVGEGCRGLQIHLPLTPLGTEQLVAVPRLFEFLCEAGSAVTRI